MKKLYLMLLSALWGAGTPAQVVINEVYAEPGATSHEFFELYNTSHTNNPISLDGYTLMSYFEEGNKKGFYVLDLPNLLIAPRGFFVGSAALPFNYQGTTGSMSSDFSWNSLLLAASYGYLRKWVATGNTAADGNRNYDLAPLAPGFNDLFSKQTGNGASYNAFLYKNGVLINAFLGGTGGGGSLPASIASMPVFRLESLTASGSRTYNLSWNGGKVKKPEYVIQDIGSDNGFIRERDGMCGTWNKGSAQVFHTPKQPNGGAQTDVAGLLTINAHIYPGSNASDPAFVVYNVSAGPADLFPMELFLYTDNGSVAGQLDANDTFVEAATEGVLSDGPFTSYFTPAGANLIIVAQTATGCWDQVKYVPNGEIAKTPLPLQLHRFTGRYSQGRSELEWVASANESGERFEVEKSSDGRTFTKTATVHTTGKEGEAYYTFSESVSGGVYYRLKLVNRDGSTSRSAVVLVKNEAPAAALLHITPNPVGSSLVFTYGAARTETITVNIYNSTGVKVASRQLAAQKGMNHYTLPLGAALSSGAYILEVMGVNDKRMEQFIRR